MSIRLERLYADDLSHLVALQAAICTEMPEGYLQPRSAHQLGEFLAGQGGIAFGLRQEGQLLAAGLLRLPGPQGVRLTFPGVPPHDWPGAAALAEGALVAPVARGLGLQRRLLDRRAAAAAGRRRRWLCAATHLENGASWRNLLRAGFRLVGIRDLASFTQIAFLRPLSTGTFVLEERIDRRVSARDATGHAEALAAGLVGTALDGEGLITYCRPAAPIGAAGAA